ncbi:MAG TPA: chromophore lyase CpcT/CpeT [Steroidobacteraceae bacterium]|nr:chromophore lyase CpcT/CpeT [Steroidobacteraceae bacterium]
MKKSEADLAQLVAWLPGNYDNSEQVQQDAQQGREPHTALSLTVVPIHMPTFGDHVFYLHESVTDDPRRVTRQRLLSFQAVKGGVLETLYTLNEPARWREGRSNPRVFTGMMYNDAQPMAGCDLLWKRAANGLEFAGENPAGGCRATVPALGGSVRLEMRGELTAGTLSLSELAYGANGQLVRGEAGEPFYRYRKRSGN